MMPKTIRYIQKSNLTPEERERILGEVQAVLWEEPMVFNKLFAVGDDICEQGAWYKVAAVTVQDDVQIVTLDPRPAVQTPPQKIPAPWTQDQVDALNRYQEEGWMHPFTCCSGNRTDEHHLDGEGKLVATEKGWICPYCPYVQDWAWEFMFKPRPW